MKPQETDARRLKEGFFHLPREVVVAAVTDHAGRQDMTPIAQGLRDNVLYAPRAV